MARSPTSAFTRDATRWRRCGLNLIGGFSIGDCQIDCRSSSEKSSINRQLSIINQAINPQSSIANLPMHSSRRQSNGDGRATSWLAADVEQPAMIGGYAAGNRKTESGAAWSRPSSANESPRYFRNLVVWNAHPLVRHFDGDHRTDPV